LGEEKTTYFDQRNHLRNNNLFTEENRSKSEWHLALHQAQVERTERRNWKRFGPERQLKQHHRKNVQKIWTNSCQSDCDGMFIIKV